MGSLYLSGKALFNSFLNHVFSAYYYCNLVFIIRRCALFVTAVVLPLCPDDTLSDWLQSNC